MDVDSSSLKKAKGKITKTISSKRRIEKKKAKRKGHMMFSTKPKKHTKSFSK